MTNNNNKHEQDILSQYIKGLENQDIKVLILKLKNEMKKKDVTWEQVRSLLLNIKNKDEKILFDIIPLILEP